MCRTLILAASLVVVFLGTHVGLAQKTAPQGPQLDFQQGPAAWAIHDGGERGGVEVPSSAACTRRSSVSSGWKVQTQRRP